MRKGLAIAGAAAAIVIGTIFFAKLIYDTDFEPISAEGCGVIATIIPVLLLAGLFDGSYLHSANPPAPNGGPGTKETRWQKFFRLSWIPIYAYGTVTILAGLSFACVGVAGDGISADQQLEAFLVWAALANSMLYVPLSVLSRVTAARQEDRERASDRSIERDRYELLMQLLVTNSTSSGQTVTTTRLIAEEVHRLREDLSRQSPQTKRSWWHRLTSDRLPESLSGRRRGC
jgi:hypothetical protein